MEKLITSEMFKGRFLKNLPTSFVWQKTPLQIYPLSSMSDYFELPTPLLKTDYNFLIYIKEGSFTQQIGLEKITIKSPGIVYASIGTIISMEKIHKKMKGYFVLIEDKTMSSFFKEGSSLNLFNIFPVLSIQKDDSEWIHNICELMHKELISKNPNPDIGHSLLQALLYKILVLSNNEKSLSRTQQIAIKFKQLVYINFKEEKTTFFYAKSLNISENYLNRCVKEVFHKNAKECILQISILHAQLLLWDISKPVSEICFELKFDDPSYFSRLFKKITGLTPTEFRNSLLHDLS